MLAPDSSSLFTSGCFRRGEMLAEEESVSGDENHILVRYGRNSCHSPSPSTPAG